MTEFNELIERAWIRGGEMGRANRAEIQGDHARAVIDWIEAELMDDANFRDIPDILADARERFVQKSVQM